MILTAAITALLRAGLLKEPAGAVSGSISPVALTADRWCGRRGSPEAVDEVPGPVGQVNAGDDEDGQGQRHGPAEHVGGDSGAEAGPSLDGADYLGLRLVDDAGDAFDRTGDAP